MSRELLPRDSFEILREAIDDFRTNELRINLLQLPTELRLEIYDAWMLAEPPIIDEEGELRHPLLHSALRAIQNEAYSALFHAAPLVLSPYYPCDRPHITTRPPFLQLHDRVCNPSTTSRIRTVEPCQYRTDYLLPEVSRAHEPGSRWWYTRFWGLAERQYYCRPARPDEKERFVLLYLRNRKEAHEQVRKAIQRGTGPNLRPMTKWSDHAKKVWRMFNWKFR